METERDREESGAGAHQRWEKERKNLRRQSRGVTLHPDRRERKMAQRVLGAWAEWAAPADSYLAALLPPLPSSFPRFV